MPYAAKPDRELSDTPWSKEETILIAKFRTQELRAEFTKAHSDWIPVTEKLPELRKLIEEIGRNPGINDMPWPLRVWVTAKSRGKLTLAMHLSGYRDRARIDWS